MGDEIKVYLPQIEKYVADLFGKPQQTLYLNGDNEPIPYKCIDEGDIVSTDAIIVICDSDINVTNAIWHYAYGMGLNPVNDSMEEIHKNADKVHVLLWNNACEVGEDERGYFVNYEGALNGILCINNECMTAEKLDKMLEYAF